jgi:hypothetical protein
MPKLLSLPLRIARGTIELEISLARIAFDLARGIVAPGSTRLPPPAPSPMRPSPAQPAPSPMRPSPAQPAPPIERAEPMEQPPRRPPRPEPDEIVASAGPGEHAGPEIHVAPPWQGYDEMPLHDILARLEEADEAAVAVVRLYESQHENRQAILLATGGEP